MGVWVWLAVSALALPLLFYLFLFVYWSYRAYLVFSLYIEPEAIAEELGASSKKVSPFRPSFPMVLMRRIIELEMFYDFIYEAGLDLSSLRRDYFRSLRTGVPVQVVSLYGEQDVAKGS